MRRLSVFVTVLLGLGLSVSLAFAQGYSTPPILSPSATGLSVYYSAGNVTSGGRQLRLIAGTVIVAANKTNCAAPQFVSCNLVYWDGHSTRLSTTTLPATAFAVGNELIGFITTKGSNVTGLIGPMLTYAGIPGVGAPYLGLSLPICNAVRTTGCRPCTPGTLGCR